VQRAALSSGNKSHPATAPVWRERPIISRFPSPSKTIAEFEGLLGMSLLERTSQGVEPTIYGTALARRSIALFNDLRTSTNELEPWRILPPNCG
jgi:hypothetical protein